MELGTEPVRASCLCGCNLSRRRRPAGDRGMRVIESKHLELRIVSYGVEGCEGTALLVLVTVHLDNCPFFF